MTNVTIPVSPGQLTALRRLAESENSDVESMVNRGIDMIIAVHLGSSPSLERRLDNVIKLLVSAMKLIGQTIYFSSLPLKAGPVKGKLNDEGNAFHWLQSEKFAADLLSPPQLVRPQTLDPAETH